MKNKWLYVFFSMVLGCSTIAQTAVYAEAVEETEVSEKVLEASDSVYIEETLNLANNEAQAWTYSGDAWILSVVSAVAYPELPDQQGVSVCVPGAYVKGIDTDGDGQANVTAETAEGEVYGQLVIDYEAEITSSNGQVYTAATAPVILNTGAAGYGSSNNSKASATYAAEGYINVACGNRGKQDVATDENGNSYYTGDAPSCLVDQKAAARYVKYNILLGNLPGNVEYFVSTGGSGGGAHAAMFAATSNNPDFYDYEIEAGAVGVYRMEDGSYSTTVTIDGEEYELSDGAWGCVAYSAITSLYEADMAQAFEYYMDVDYDFSTSFQKQMAEYLSESYMNYINEKGWSVQEASIGFDLNGDGDMDDVIDLTIEYDLENYPETNGYYGTYLDLYLAEFTENLQWYLDNLDYAEGWTWFDENGEALSDEAVAAMTAEEKATAFIEGRYAKSSAGGMMDGMAMGNLPDGMTMGEMPDGMTMGEMPDGMTMGEMPDGAQMSELPDGEQLGEMPDGEQLGELPDGAQIDGLTDTEAAEGKAVKGGRGNFENGNGKQMGNLPNAAGNEMEVGTPDMGTTQSATGSKDSANYATYEEMLASYQEDIEAVYAGDEYGKNIVELYNPLNYIGDEETEDAAWIRIVMGAAEGDMSMFSSLNLQIALLNAGVDAEIEWQWDGGHVPSEIFGSSLSLYVDQMYGKYVEVAVSVEKAAAEAVTENGTAETATGTDLSSWVNIEDITNVSFSLADAVSYRTKGASKAVPGFDVIDYGQEDYVFGDEEKDARHWDIYVLNILEEYADTLAGLFNQN